MVQERDRGDEFDLLGFIRAALKGLPRMLAMAIIGSMIGLILGLGIAGMIDTIRGFPMNSSQSDWE